MMRTPSAPLADIIELIPDDYFRLLRREEIFPDTSRPLELDVGCGDGTFLMEMAAHFPDRDFLGIERLGGRVNAIRRKAARRGLTNVRLLCLESSYALGWLLPDNCASRLHLLFPDPWPKKKHARRRFIQEENLTALHRVLAPGGELLFKTDHAAYFTEACETMDAGPHFRRESWPFGEFYPLTDFEQLWLSQGCAIHAARWVKTS
ncbi:MAG TPA: tRNA (guanosine(46)-N7)-methyltransferase TrmB [Verrucomicrobiales bacterium]|nr:tRNA (guanosine(46)-N7)-methyltransferase TrmB [Verrucomicrobiales bacterium]